MKSKIEIKEHIERLNKEIEITEESISNSNSQDRKQELQAIVNRFREERGFYWEML